MKVLYNATGSNQVLQTNVTLQFSARVFTNRPRDRSSIQGRVLPKTQKMVFDTALLNM